MNLTAFEHTLMATILLFAAFAAGSFLGKRSGYKEGIHIVLQSLVNLNIINDYDVEMENESEGD
jgi:hypothetical protein